MQEKGPKGWDWCMSQGPPAGLLLVQTPAPYFRGLHKQLNPPGGGDVALSNRDGPVLVAHDFWI